MKYEWMLGLLSSKAGLGPWPTGGRQPGAGVTVLLSHGPHGHLLPWQSQSLSESPP